MNATKRVLKIISKRPQYMTITDLTFAQVDSWFKHCRRDLRMNIMYPQYTQGKNIRVLYGFVEAAGSRWTNLHIIYI